MASETYSASVIVLKKTKLGESDLILTFLNKDGSQLKAVAKGARKPSNSFASRLELFSVSEILACKGKSLDIVKEARMLESNQALRGDIIYTTAAAPMVEVLEKVSQLDLENPKLFEMTRVGLRTLGGTAPQKTAALTAAHLLKTFAFVGLRPSLDLCVDCGNMVDLTIEGERLAFSYSEGGLLCKQCGPHIGSFTVAKEMIKWMSFLYNSTFEEISRSQIDNLTSLAILEFCQKWIKEHMGLGLKSLGFLLTSGLYQ